VLWATTWIGYFYILTFIIGFGAISFVLTNPQFLDAKGGLLGGGNMAAIHLANAVGGNVFLGSSRPWPLPRSWRWWRVDAVGRLRRVTRPVCHGHQEGQRRQRRRTEGVAPDDGGTGHRRGALGIAFEKQNIAFMVSLAFAIAASANFPVLLMSVLWKDCTTRGAVVGGFLGLISSVLLTIVSPSVWEATLGNPKGSALFPYASPALFSMTIGFVGIWLFSILDRSPRAAQDRGGFLAQQVRSETGIGASGASGH
jgi:cation/acetate symporter